jgi:hypothetical protein
MGAETVGTLVVVGIIVAVLALYVFLIGLGLKRLSFTLGTIVVGLRAIREQTKPVGAVLGGIVGDAEHIESALAGVVAAVGAGPAADTTPSMREAVAAARMRGDGAVTETDGADGEPAGADGHETGSRRAPRRRVAGGNGAESPMRRAVAEARHRLGVS